ncbi:MAG TPA: hypothetical protein HPQ04_08960 [Rhodospirillaceae bacterium]|nr:hypothetical protein [Rhodospirillaceae bacterium]
MVLVMVAFPVALLVFLGMTAKIVTNIEAMKSEVTALTKHEYVPNDASGMLAQLFQDQHKSITALLTAQVDATTQIVQVTRDSRDGIVDELKSQTLISKEINQELTQIAENSAAAPGKEIVAGASQRIDRMHALAEVLAFALNDLSMTATQLLTELLDEVHGDKDGTRTFISTLTNAYFAGDKNVFFRSLAREVAASAETLTQIAGESDVVRQQISKVLREAREVKSLVGSCDPNDLVRIVFEDGDLWDMEKALSEHFSPEGDIVGAA